MSELEIQLLSYFSEIIWVHYNPYKFTVTEKFKKDGNIKTQTTTKDIILKSVDKSELSSILKDISENCTTKEIEFYPKSLFKKLFKIKNINQLISELELFSDDNFFILSSIDLPVKHEIVNFLEKDIILIGDKSKSIYLRKINENCEYFVEYSFFTKIRLI